MINELSDVSVLSVGPSDKSRAQLAHFLRALDWASLSGGATHFCSQVDAALKVLRNQRVPIVLCDSDADWRGLLEEMSELPHPPFLIVTSRLADDRLWSEALNLGAYDVLSKPFDRAEVARVLMMAWIRWVEKSSCPQPSRCGWIAAHA